MNTQDTNNDTKKNVIDATAKLQSARGRTPEATEKQRPKLRAAEIELLDRYIAGRRKERAGKEAAAALKEGVLEILRVHKQIERKGAQVRLGKTYDWQYDTVIAELEKELAEARERAREDGSAKVTITPNVTFEDIRAKERKRKAS